MGDIISIFSTFTLVQVGKLTSFFVNLFPAFAKKIYLYSSYEVKQ